MSDWITVKRPSAEKRVSFLKERLAQKRCLRFIEVFSPLSALVVESLVLKNGSDHVVQYDGFWSSSLTDSTSRGKPDIELLDVRSRLPNVNEIFENTTKPLIIDGDTGGRPEHLALNIPLLEAAGVSAIVIEDKTGLKKNSLLGTDVPQQQEEVAVFCDKIRRARDARSHPDFMVIARVESLILDKGLDDALARAQAYTDAGADGIMIHSRRREPDEIFAFAAAYRAANPRTLLVCVPTSYNTVHFDLLAERGFNVVIYANHLLRAAFPAMQAVARGILENGRSLEVEPMLLPIESVLTLIPGTK